MEPLDPVQTLGLTQACRSPSRGLVLPCAQARWLHVRARKGARVQGMVFLRTSPRQGQGQGRVSRCPGLADWALSGLSQACPCGLRGASGSGSPLSAPFPAQRGACSQVRTRSERLCGRRGEAHSSEPTRPGHSVDRRWPGAQSWQSWPEQSWQSSRSVCPSVASSLMRYVTYVEWEPVAVLVKLHGGSLFKKGTARWGRLAQRTAAVHRPEGRPRPKPAAHTR